jgi:protein O-mannosyl-transferase
MRSRKIVREPAVEHRTACSSVAAIAALLFLAFVVYWPSLRGGFILDDDFYLTDNGLIRSPEGLHDFWFTNQAADYYPVSNSVLWIEWQMWGKDPTGYHVANVAIHGLNCILIWLILRRLQVPLPFIGALLFLVHPVNVEAVAWIAQCKTVTSSLFFLLSILCYLHYDDLSLESRPDGLPSRSRLWWATSLLLFGLGLLSKTSAAVLPAVIVLLIWWKRRTIQAKDIVRTMPFFALALALIVVGIWMQNRGMGSDVRPISLLERIAGAGAAIWFYLYKAVLPFDLCFIYPRWEVSIADFPWWLPSCGVIIASWLLWRQRLSAWGRSALVGWLYYCVALSPMLGFLTFGFLAHSLVADHYQYLALIAIVAVAAAWVSRIKANAAGISVRFALPLTIAAVLTVLSWQQNQLYSSPITLYEATLQKNPDAWLAQTNLAAAYLENGRTERAVQHARHAAQIAPYDTDTAVNYSTALVKSGDPLNAILFLRPLLATARDPARVENALGFALQTAGQLPEAIEHYQKAVELKVPFAEAQYNLGTALAQSGRIADSIPHFRAAVNEKPDFAEAHFNLGTALLRTGDRDGAIAQYRQALLSKPGYERAGRELERLSVMPVEGVPQNNK